ncbi:MAG: type II toxin-antitoxin system RatA family toxin [Rhodospirillales bacterium]|nr:type II toxin-antitoxin system RatA family toxin [Rhodospirillales bacterium]
MPTYSETKPVSFTVEQMFDLAADVEAYPEFLPWCVATRIKKRVGDTIHADMVIGFQMFREKFTTEAKLDRPNRIDVTYRNGPFKYLKSYWIFTEIEENNCEIDFHIDFEFRSPMLQQLIGRVFGEAVKQMVFSFEKRAKQLYR